MTTQKQSSAKLIELEKCMKSCIPSKKVFFFDEETKTHYEIEDITWVDDKLYIIGGKNHNGLELPRNYPINHNESDKCTENVF